MSSLFNPYALTALGKPLQQRQSPELRVETPYISRAQRDMAQHTFVRFLDQARLSMVPNPTEQGRLADGTPYRIVTASGAPIMQVWPVAEETLGSRLKFASGFVFESPDSDAYYVIDAVMKPLPENGAEDQEGQRGVHTGEWVVVKLSPSRYKKLHVVDAIDGDLAPSVRGAHYYLGGAVYGIKVVDGFDEIPGITHRNVMGYTSIVDSVEGEKYYLVLVEVKDGELRQSDIELQRMPGPVKGKSNRVIYTVIDPEEVKFRTVVTGVRTDSYRRPYQQNKLIYEHAAAQGFKAKYSVMVLNGLLFSEVDTVEIPDDVIEPEGPISVYEDGTPLNNENYIILDISDGSLEPTKSEGWSATGLGAWQSTSGFWGAYFQNVDVYSRSSMDAEFFAHSLDYEVIVPPSFDRVGAPVLLIAERRAEYSTTASQNSSSVSSSHAAEGAMYATEAEAAAAAAAQTWAPGLEWPVANHSSNSSIIHENTIKRECKLADGRDFILMDSISKVTFTRTSNSRIHGNTGFEGDYINKSLKMVLDISITDRELLAYDPELNLLVYYEGKVKAEYSGTDTDNTKIMSPAPNIRTIKFADLPKIESIKLQYSRVSISLGRDVKVEIPITTRLADIYPCFHSPCGWVSGGEVLPDTIGVVKYRYISQIPYKIPVKRGESEIYEIYEPHAVAPKQYRINKPEIICRVYKTPRAGALFIHILIDGDEFKYFVNSKAVIEVSKMFKDYKINLDDTVGDDRVEII